MKHAHRMKVLGLSIVIAASVCVPAIVQAQGVVDTIKGGLTSAATPAGYTKGATDLPTIVGGLIGAALGLLGVLLLVYIMYGGFLWMTAGGDEKKVISAKNVIKNAIIGLVIIASSYALANFILGPQGLGAAFGSSTTSPGVTPK